MTFRDALLNYVEETDMVDSIYEQIHELIKQKCVDENKFNELLNKLEKYKDKPFAQFDVCKEHVSQYLDELQSAYFND